jgi:hypothetical protein
LRSQDSILDFMGREFLVLEEAYLALGGAIASIRGLPSTPEGMDNPKAADKVGAMSTVWQGV